MNTPIHWTCPNCNEQHQDVFDICWKCGVNPVGEIDPEFLISEPVREEDQARDSRADITELPALLLPDFTYFSIPPIICIILFVQFIKIEEFGIHQIPNFTLSPIEIVIGCAAFILVLAPISLTVCRRAFAFSRTRPRFLDSLVEYRRILSMFLLPESIQRSHRWFAPLYYGSFIAMALAHVGAAVWLMTR